MWNVRIPAVLCWGTGWLTLSCCQSHQVCHTLIRPIVHSCLYQANVANSKPTCLCGELHICTLLVVVLQQYLYTCPYATADIAYRGRSCNTAVEAKLAYTFGLQPVCRMFKTWLCYAGVWAGSLCHAVTDIR